MRVTEPSRHYAYSAIRSSLRTRRCIAGPMHGNAAALTLGATPPPSANGGLVRASGSGWGTATAETPTPFEQLPANAHG